MLDINVSVAVIIQRHSEFKRSSSQSSERKCAVTDERLAKCQTVLKHEFSMTFRFVVTIVKVGTLTNPTNGRNNKITDKNEYRDCHRGHPITLFHKHLSDVH